MISVVWLEFELQRVNTGKNLRGHCGVSGEIIGSRNFSLVFKWGEKKYFTSGCNQLCPCCASCPAARGRKRFLSHSCTTFTCRPTLPAHKEECFKFLSHLAAVGYPRARNEREARTLRLSENTITEKKNRQKCVLFFFTHPLSLGSE